MMGLFDLNKIITYERKINMYKKINDKNIKEESFELLNNVFEDRLFKSGQYIDIALYGKNLYIEMLRYMIETKSKNWVDNLGNRYIILDEFLDYYLDGNGNSSGDLYGYVPTMEIETTLKKLEIIGLINFENINSNDDNIAQDKIKIYLTDIVESCKEYFINAILKKANEHAIKQ